MVRNAARASRRGLAVGILRVLCNGMCATRRLHVENEEHSCRVGCLDEPDCLSPILTSAFSFPTFLSHLEGTPRSTLVETQNCMISSLRPHTQACNVGLWSWDSLMPSSTPTTITVTTRTAQENFRIAWRREFALCQPSRQHMPTRTKLFASQDARLTSTHIIDGVTSAGWGAIARSPDGNSSSCLVQSLPLRPTLLVEERDYTSTTRWNSPASLKHRPFSGLQDRSAAARRHVFFLWLKTSCQRLCGNDSVTHERTFRYDESAVVIANSAEHQNHKAHLKPWTKRGK